MGKVNPYEAPQILQKLEEFYESHKLSNYLSDVPSKKLAIYLMQVRIDKRKGGGF